MSKWFATQVDRDFNSFYDHDTMLYGNGVRLYYESNPNYVIINGVSFENGILTVKDKDDNIYTLKEEPNNVDFEDTIYANWKKWDETYGKYDDDRCDYEPWAYDSIKSLACELNLLESDEKVKMYYKKDY
tara:strand:+ start:61 stop:450 length:390 start_codon:yes stop_codon:yes gene_type:complete